mmetsp:Transcript_6303/g.19037  ORF Transcript_6303/g.19037 Transcript_6303/m.19037 type:complete len:387 (+) Transcript_6303:137-1297(+)
MCCCCEDDDICEELCREQCCNAAGAELYCNPIDHLPISAKAEARCYVGVVTFLILFTASAAVVMLAYDPLAYPPKTAPIRVRGFGHRTLGKHVQDKDKDFPSMQSRRARRYESSYRNVTVVDFRSKRWDDLPENMRMIRSRNLLHVVLFSVLIGMSFLCYFKTHSTDPGGALDWERERPDLVWPQDSEEHSESEDVEASFVVGSKVSGLNRGGTDHCEKCNASKPPRLHHCSSCQRCILRMDHHCPWVGNCIGFLNMKYFLLFLVYTASATVYFFFIFVRFIAHVRFAPSLSSTFIMVLSISLPFAVIIAGGAFVSTTILFCWSMYLSLHNMTNVEYYKWKKAKEKREPYTLYSRGAYRNLQHILGKNWIFWLMPFRFASQRHLKN